MGGVKQVKQVERLLSPQRKVTNTHRFRYKRLAYMVRRSGLSLFVWVGCVLDDVTITICVVAPFRAGQSKPAATIPLNEMISARRVFGREVSVVFRGVPWCSVMFRGVGWTCLLCL